MLFYPVNKAGYSHTLPESPTLKVFTKQGGFSMAEQLTKEILDFESDHIWVYENFDDLFEKYADQWIGVRNYQVIASDSDLMRLRNKLSNPAHTCIEFITREPLEMIL